MFKKYLVIVFILIWIALAINPLDRGIWMLENLIVVVIFPAVLWLDKKYNFTNFTFLCLTVFVVLHLFGAHLTYEKMAYFTWLSDLFGLKRNYYDHIVHFLFGLLVFMSFYEISFRQGLSRKLSYLIAFLFISSISSWYEILEWFAMAAFCDATDCVALITQWDEWDAQKDMLYAVFGALITMVLHSAKRIETSRH